jgi:Family of unknown function (DUF5906)
MPLALVTDTAQPEPDYSEPDIALAATHTAEEKAIYKEYAQDLKKRGFCKLTNSAANYTQIYNRFNRQAFTPCFISEDFFRWRRRNRKACRTPTTPYITYSLQHIIGQKFIPNEGDYWTDEITGCSYANTWREYKPTTDKPPALSPLCREYFERLLPVESERHLFLQWVAHIFQRPAERPSWHVMFTSEPGTGKGFLVEELLHPLLHHTQVIATYAKLTGQFSTTLEDNLLVLLDDCKARTEAQQTTLKSLLSEERAYVERKGLQGGMVQTYTRFILASNEAKPLDLEASERRWFVPTAMVHKVDLEETQAFIESFQDWLDLPGSLDAVYQFFVTYDLDGFKHKYVAKTATLEGMVKLSKGIHGDLLQDFIAEHRVFTTAEWMAEYDKQGMPKLRDAKAIPALLLEAGYEKGLRTIRGTRLTLCYPVGMTLEQIEATYPEASF